jgi:hypothetical protein
MNISALEHLNCEECLIASAAYARMTAPVRDTVISISDVAAAVAQLGSADVGSGQQPTLVLSYRCEGRYSASAEL